MRARWLAVISGILLLLIVFMTVFLRYELVQKQQPDVPLGFLGYVLVLLPMLVLIGELFTGDYSWYSLRLILMCRERDYQHRHFQAYKALCCALDKEAVARRAFRSIGILRTLHHAQ